MVRAAGAVRGRVRRKLARLGYTQAGTRRKFEVVAHLSHWLAERGMTADDIAGSASSGRRRTRGRRRARGICLSGSGRSWRTGAGLRPRRAARSPGLARRFLAAAGPDGETGRLVSALTASDVTAFLADMTRIQAPGTTQNTASMLQTFLTWL